MKRRIPLAVLPVIALVTAAGSGGSTTAAAGAGEGFKGGPWTGSPGVTVPVSSMMARQRLVDWGFAAPPLRGRDRPEREAEGEGGSDGGSEVAGGGEEPVEQEAPPKSPASAASRALSRSAAPSAAVSAQSQLQAGTSFRGAHLVGDSTFRPPDSMGAVGPTQILVTVNGRIRVFDKDGTPGPLDVTDSNFWSSVRGGLDVTDPQVEYDRLSQRWILSQINFDPTNPSMVNNRIMIAVSSGPTITSQSDFTFYFFNQNGPNPGSTAQFADYPQMGVDANAIYIGTNDFAASGAFASTTAFVIRKSSVIGPGPIAVTAFRGLAVGSGPGPESPQPAQNMDPGTNQGYIIGPDNAVFGRLDVRRITDPGGTPSISGNLALTVPATTFPEDVPAQGSPNKLDALDDRLFEAMIGRAENGDLSLWTAHNIEVNASGVASTNGNRDGARWYEIGNLSTTPTLIQAGTLFDAAASSPRFFWIPSIAMNGQGHASLNASTAGNGRFAEVAGTAHLASDPPNFTEPFDITKTSSSTYNLGDTPERWGDYSQTVVDPTDNQTFWTFQEYTEGTDDWGVRVIKLMAPPPATPSTASPSTVAAGQCSVAVDVEGTSTSGSGFFDPGPDPGGPGYPSHIGASATGGVTVRSVDYVDPTHVTLDLDTRGATAGAQDLTITNPDGQDVTASGLITVGASGTTPPAPCLDGTVPLSPGNDNSPLVFGDAEAGSTVEIFDNDACTGTPVGTGTAAEFASPGIAVDDVADNSTTTYYAAATDSVPQTSDCSSALTGPGRSEEYVEDSTLPAVSIDSGPSGLTADSTPTFSFSATDVVGPISFQCSIDTGLPTFRSCSGPGNINTPSSPLVDGAYTFRVQATDGAGNLKTATRDFQVDATPPAVSVDSGPSGPTSDNTPTFSFSATDPAPPVSFQCSIDTGTAAFGACSGPGDTDTPASGLPDASYTFRVQATDGAGNSSVATRPFSVKATPPETTITKGPKKTRKPRPKFKFAASEPGSTFRCQLDSRPTLICTSPFKPPKLKLGQHVLRVGAVDALGNVDPSPAVRKFRVLPD